MTNSSIGIFDKVDLAWKAFNGRLKDISIAQSVCSDDQYEALQDMAAQVEAQKERETCRIAGIPYHGWAHDVHCCARRRGDRQTLDMAKIFTDQAYQQKSAYCLFCFAMMGFLSSPYCKLVWGREPEGVPGE